MSSNSVSRIDAIDWMKGLCIICIVLLHIEDGIFSHQVNTFIGLFMITGFYVTSGWVHGMKNPCKIELKKFIQKRYHTLGIPYLWFTGIILILDIFFCLVDHYEWNIFFRDVYKSLVFRGIGTLWFLPVLFIGELLFVICRKYKCLLLGAVFSILGQWGIKIVFDWIDNIFYGVQRALIEAPLAVVKNIMLAWLIISASYWISSRMNKKQWSKVRFTITGCIVFIVALFLFRFQENSPLAIQQINGILLSCIEPLGIFFLLMGFKWNCFITNYWGYWGRNSIILMAVHYSILMEFIIWIYTLLFETPPYGWSTLVCFALIMLIQYPIAEFINKRCKYIIGQ